MTHLVLFVLVAVRAVAAAVLLRKCFRLMSEVSQEMTYRALHKLNGIQTEMLQNEWSHRRWHAWFFACMGLTALIQLPFVFYMPAVRWNHYLGAVIMLALTVSGGYAGVFLREQERRRLILLSRQERQKPTEPTP